MAKRVRASPLEGQRLSEEPQLASVQIRVGIVTVPRFASTSWQTATLATRTAALVDFYVCNGLCE
ncbi:hypothetical protein VE03_06814 [Pseudogymnoascus sp. 23342-1-I1]|nr:hypothetical protein VE03_06814 [Pseudogymnoascus sp. 23342-1-I1]